MADLKLILALWGAVVSTILAISKLIERRKDSTVKLFINCQETIQENEEHLSILVSNIWKRPVSIVGFSWGLGNFEKHQQIIFEYPLNEVKKLDESDIFRTTVNKQHLLDSVQDFSDSEFMFKRLWVNVRLSSGKVISSQVAIDKVKYEINVHPKYDDLLTSAKFFERDLISRYNELFELKMKHLNK